MQTIRINGRNIQLDIEAELREYNFHNERWTSDKLIASSPFRDDYAPSFFVNLSGEYAGAWGDSGAYGTEYESGNFVRLIAYLRGESSEQALDYLTNKYGELGEYKLSEKLRIARPNLRQLPRERVVLNSKVERAISPYLISRGISPDIQSQFGVGYNSENPGFTALPWHYTDTGFIANIKYRATAGKRFFYEADAMPISQLVYGLFHARHYSEAVICEGEIDALSFWTADIPAIATGSARMSRKQAEQIIRSGFDVIYLAGDNDAQGRLFNDYMRERFRGYAELREIEYPEKEKDANDVLLRHGAGMIFEMVEAAESARIIRID